MKIKKNKRGNTKVQFTPQEQAAMNKEIEDQLLDFVGANLLEIEALMMMQLRTQFKFGKKRLKRFYKNFNPTIYDYMVRKLNRGEECEFKTNLQKLKDVGCDLEELVLEREEYVNAKN